MFKKTIVLFSALTLFVSSSFAGDAIIKKKATVKNENTKVYRDIPKGTNVNALFKLKAGDSLVVVHKPSVSDTYTKALFKGDKHGWVRTKDIDIDLKSTVMSFEEVEITVDFWANSYGEIIDTKQDDIPLLEVELSFMDKIKTNTDKEKASRAAKK